VSVHSVWCCASIISMPRYQWFSRRLPTHNPSVFVSPLQAPHAPSPTLIAPDDAEIARKFAVHNQWLRPSSAINIFGGKNEHPLTTFVDRFFLFKIHPSHTHTERHTSPTETHIPPTQRHAPHTQRHALLPQRDTSLPHRDTHPTLTLHRRLFHKSQVNR
jgi:hypothetical protein